MAVLYEEQKLIQSFVSFPFRKTISFFKTIEKFDSLTIYPPTTLRLEWRANGSLKGWKEERTRRYASRRRDTMAEHLRRALRGARCEGADPEAVSKAADLRSVARSTAGRMGDALAPGGEEGCGRLRKAATSG